MAGQLVASLQLNFEDHVTAALGKLDEQVRRLRDMAKQMGFSELAEGIERLRVGDSALDGLERGLRATATQADSAANALNRVASANDNIRRTSRLAQVGGGILGAGRGVLHAGRHFSETASGAIGGVMGAAMEGFAVYEPIKMFAERDALLRQIGMMKGLSGPKLEAEIKRLNTFINNEAMETGTSGTSDAEALKDLLGQGLKANVVERVLRAHSEAARAYNINPEVLGPITGSIVGNLGIEDQKGAEAALAKVAYSGQHGRVKIENYSRSLPHLTGIAASLGMKGQSGLDTLLAASEITAKLSSDGTQSGYNLADLLSYMTSNREDNVTRKRAHIDLPALLLRGEKQGKSAFDTYIDFFRQNTAGKTPIQQSQFISSLVGNTQARAGLLAIVQHYPEFVKIRQEIEKISALKLKIDNASVLGSPDAQLQNLGEALHQINLILGEGFLPTLTLVNKGLVMFLEGLTWLSINHPATLQWVLRITAGLLALGAALTVLGALGGVIAAGWGLVAAVFSPVMLAIYAVAGAAFLIYRNWDTIGAFFVGVWRDAKVAFTEFASWAENWATALSKRINDALAAIHFGFDIHSFSDSALGKLLQSHQLSELPQLAGVPSIHNTPAGPAAGRSDSLAVTVKAEPGTAVTGIVSSNPNHTIATTPNPGRTLNRP